MPPSLIARVALALVPARDRDALLGDLHEEGACTPWRCAVEIARVGAAYQREPYRDDRTRLGILALLVIGLALLRVVSHAANGMTTPPFDGAIWRASAAFWSHGTPVAAFVTGLVVGRAPLIPEHAAHVRWHVALLLAAAAAIVAVGWQERVLAAALLLAASLLGASARHDVPPPTAPA